ncbi:MAG: hypothetical protein P4L55_10040 [Syntrophobacteraceae bacterium]|nr:hypothetical protein [Syntrophobacteraceae bacterium]
MRKILSGALIALSIMGFALVSGIPAPAVASTVGPMCWAGSCPAMSTPDAVRPGGPYACGISSPANPGYYNARELACPAGGKLAVTAN